jgi:hypothetical protein
MPTLLAYHNDRKIKSKYIRRVEAHRKADELVQGTGWESNGVTRGCAVGCIFNAYDHTRGPKEIGVPEELIAIADTIHEGLPRSQAIGSGPKDCWPRQFLGAIRPGADLSLVFPKLAVWCLTDAKWGETALPDQSQDALECCLSVAALWQRVIDGESQFSLRDKFLEEEERAWAGAWAGAGAGAGAGARAWAWAWAGAGAGARAWAWAWAGAGAGAWAWARAGFWRAIAQKTLDLLAEAP